MSTSGHGRRANEGSSSGEGCCRAHSTFTSKHFCPEHASYSDTERLSTARAGGARPERLSAGLEQRAGLRQSPSPPRHRWSWRRRIFRACTLSRERVVLRPEHTEDTKSGLSSPQIRIQIPLAAARAPDAPRADARAERAGSSGVSRVARRARWLRPER